MGSLTTSGLFRCDITDHLPVFTLFDCDVKKTKKDMKVIHKRIRTEETINALNNSLLLQDWSTVYRESDVDSGYGHFLDILISLYNTHCPAEERCIETKKN